MQLKDYADVTPEIIKRYNCSGPRYTSYPTVPVWNTGDESSNYDSYLEREGQRNKELSLYIHIPFCKQLCTFCGCNKFITNNQSMVEHYLKTLDQEFKYIADKMGAQEGIRKTLAQLHLGGGTPTYLTPDQLKRLMDSITTHFDLSESGEMALEAHPRRTSLAHLKTLYELGFRRISFGVQDTDVEVQRAINRNQTPEQTQSMFYGAKELGYDSINIDLVYGLPRQTPATFKKSLEEVTEMCPDRLAVYSFAYIPNMFHTHERAIKAEDLPTPEEKIEIYLESIRHFTSNGYAMIGMDHYALETDELAIAQREHTLHRNFMGYTTLRGTSQIGTGVSAISDFGDGYFQNNKDIEGYTQGVEAQKLSIIRGMKLSQDDVLRREVIENLMCHGVIDVEDLRERHDINFKNYFSDAWKLLQKFEEEHLLELSDSSVQLTRLGTLFMRNVAMSFDYYLSDESKNFNFSKTI